MSQLLGINRTSLLLAFIATLAIASVVLLCVEGFERIGSDESYGLMPRLEVHIYSCADSEKSSPVVYRITRPREARRANLLIQLYKDLPSLIQTEVDDVIAEQPDIDRRHVGDSTEIERLVWDLDEIDRSKIQEVLARLLSERRVSFGRRTDIWWHLACETLPSLTPTFRVGRPEWVFNSISPADDFSRIAKASLMALSGRYDWMSEILKCYDEEKESYLACHNTARNTLNLLRNEGRLEEALKQGRENLSTEEERAEYDRIAKEVIKNWPSRSK